MVLLGRLPVRERFRMAVPPQRLGSFSSDDLLVSAHVGLPGQAGM
jgi:hypothetical protein